MLLILIFTFVIAISIITQYRTRLELPNGPAPLPFIGNIHQLAYQIWKNRGVVEGYKHFEKEYGKVFTIWIGPLPMVNISDYDVAYETHVKRANMFGTRYADGMIQFIRAGRGLIASNGEFWQDHRRFALQTLRNFGFGRSLMEHRIMDEVDFRLNDFEKIGKNGIIEVHASTFFDLLIGSIINQLLVSRRFERDDPVFTNLKNNLAKTLESVSLIDAFMPFWFLESKIMRWRQEKIMAPFREIYELCVKNVADRVAEIERGEHIIEGDGDDFLDAFLVKIQKDKKDGIESSFDHETLALDIYDLWLAGQETTSTTLTWAFACLLNHPEVQEKIRKELQTVTGGTRNLSMTDKLSTPYLNAVINETQRIASILNMNLLRIIHEDTSINGQPLRAGTAVTTNIGMMHANETIYKNHKEFIPERFLEDESLEKRLIPFGIGKRSCLGESLARAELYLVLGNMMQRYRFEAVGEVPKIETTSPYGMMKRPPVYEMRMIPL